MEDLRWGASASVMCLEILTLNLHLAADASVQVSVCLPQVCFVQVMTYGLGNNNMEWVKEQQSLGFRGIITDDVPSAVQTIKLRKPGMLAPVSVVA